MRYDVHIFSYGHISPFAIIFIREYYVCVYALAGPLLSPTYMCYVWHRSLCTILVIKCNNKNVRDSIIIIITIGFSIWFYTRTHSRQSRPLRCRCCWRWHCRRRFCFHLIWLLRSFSSSAGASVLLFCRMRCAKYGKNNKSIMR